MVWWSGLPLLIWSASMARKRLAPSAIMSHHFAPL
jgi:hypothetical protein